MTVLQEMRSVHTIISEYKIPRFIGTTISEYKILIAAKCMHIAVQVMLWACIVS